MTEQDRNRKKRAKSIYSIFDLQENYAKKGMK